VWENLIMCGVFIPEKFMMIVTLPFIFVIFVEKLKCLGLVVRNLCILIQY